MNFSSFAEMYEHSLVGPLFRPWAEIMLEEVNLTSRDRVLDVACGTGIAARLAKERLGDAGFVAGVDLSPQMLSVARGAGPGIDWREGSASDLPLHEGEQFDVVLCQQGLQFFPDKPAAARQMRRALAPGGRLGIATWRPIRDMPFVSELHRIAERHLGTIIDQRHSFGEAAPLEALLHEAGLHDVRVKSMSRTIRFDDGPVFVRMNAMALAGMSPAGKQMSEEERGRVVAAIASASAEVLSSYSNEAGLAFEISTNIATARG
jgi:ubiquinone/menaquinone biosynthesis C-methylase UbiE